MSTIKSSDEHLTLNADGSSKDIKFQANGVEKASISSAGVISSDGGSTHADNVKAKFGTGNDLEIYHDGTHSYIKDVGTGDLRIKGTELSLRSDSQDEPYINCTENGAVKLYYDNSKKIETTSAGVTAQGRLEIQTPNDSSTHLVQRMGSDSSTYGYADFELINPASTASGLPALEVQIGNSAVGTFARGGIFKVNRTSTSAGANLQVDHTGASQYGLLLNSTNSGTGTHYHITITRQDTQAGYMVSSPTSIGLANSSDERLKENIQNSASATQDIKNIKVRQFDWKNDRDVHRDYGFVAQELVSVVPEAVTVGSDELNEDGTPVQIWGVDDSKLIPRLVKTIQELEARITALEA